jgi:hypothetical protein
MDFTLPAEITAKLAELDAFIESDIKPLEREHMQFFDHRREYARTDWVRTTADAREMARADPRDGKRAEPRRTTCARPASLVRGPGGAQNLMIAANPAQHSRRMEPRASTTICRTSTSIVGNFPIVPCSPPTALRS